MNYIKHSGQFMFLLRVSVFLKPLEQKATVAISAGVSMPPPALMSGVADLVFIRTHLG